MRDAHKRKEIFVMRFEVVITCKLACTRRPTKNVDDLGSVSVDPTCSQTFQKEGLNIFYRSNNNQLFI